VAVGLGENTPIKLNLERENFNALISRHSQPIRWLSSEKCPCIKDNQKPDAQCSLCRGKGIVYTTKTKFIRVETKKAPIDGVIDQDGILSVVDAGGTAYSVSSSSCGISYVTGVKKGYTYIVRYTQDFELTGVGTAEYIAQSEYKIDIPYPVEFGDVQGELLTVSASNNGNPLTVTDITRNYFTIQESLLESDQVDVTYTYLLPFKFALVNNNYQKSDQKFLRDINADGILIFPQRFEIWEKDIIVALNSTTVKKEVLRTSQSIDRLPSFYVEKIINVHSIRNGLRHDYTNGVDYILYKGISIKWLNQPLEYEQISVTYSENNTYRVIADMPSPRTSEDNRFPRKVALKLIADYSSREDF
jgi:hypothetical protein